MADPRAEADREEEEIARKRTQAEANRAIAIREQLLYANLRKERQVWSLAKAEAGNAKKNGNTEWIAAAEKAFAIAKRAVQAAATAAETAKAAPTYSLEEVETIVAAAAEAAAAVTAEREMQKQQRWRRITRERQKLKTRRGQ